MKLLQKKTTLTLSALCLLGSTYIANASYQASATVNWNELAINYIDLSGGTNAPSLTWTDPQYGIASSYSDSDSTSSYSSDYQYAWDLDAALNTNTSVSNGQSSSTRDSTTLQANASSVAGSGDNTSSSQAFNSTNFTLSGYGIAVITLPWSVSISGDTASDDMNFAEAEASASLYLDSNSDSTYSGYDSTRYGSLSSVSSGTFALSAYSNGVNPVQGTFHSYAHAFTTVSAVPDPATAYLFSTGLMAVLGYTRRKAKV